jgi:hypothetical protein
MAVNGVVVLMGDTGGSAIPLVCVGRKASTLQVSSAYPVTVVMTVVPLFRAKEFPGYAELAGVQFPMHHSHRWNPREVREMFAVM